MVANYHFVPYPLAPGQHPVLAGILTVPVYENIPGEPATIVYVQGELEQHPYHPPGRSEIDVTYRPETSSGITLRATYTQATKAWDMSVETLPVMGQAGCTVLTEVRPGVFEGKLPGENEIGRETRALIAFVGAVRALIERECGGEPYPAADTWPRLAPGQVATCTNLTYLVEATQQESDSDYSLILPAKPLHWWGYLPPASALFQAPDLVGLAAQARGARPEERPRAGGDGGNYYRRIGPRHRANTRTDCWVLTLSYLNTLTLYLRSNGDWDCIYGAPEPGAGRNLPFSSTQRHTVRDEHARSALEPLVRAIHRDLYESPGLPDIHEWRIGPTAHRIRLALANDWGEFFPLWYRDIPRDTKELPLSSLTRELIGDWAVLWEALDHRLPSERCKDAERSTPPQEDLRKQWMALGEELQSRIVAELGESYTVETIYRLDTTESLEDLLSR